MKKWFGMGMALILTMLLCLVGCGQGKESSPGVQGSEEKKVLTYARKTEELHLAQGYHQNIIDYSREGIFYFVPKGDSFQEFSFYFHAYGDEGEPKCLFEMEGGYMRDLSAVRKEDGMHYAILWIDEKAHLSEYDSAGKTCNEITLEQEDFVTPGKFPMLLALSEGGFLIGLDDKVYLASADGSFKQTVSLQDGLVRNLAALGDGRQFAIYEKKWDGATGMCIAELDMEKGRVTRERKLPVADGQIFVFDEGRMVYCENDFAWLFDMDEGKDEKLIDLKKQNILASQIQGVYGSVEEILVVLADSTEGEDGNLVVWLTAGEADGTEASGKEDKDSLKEQGKKKEREKYAPDGRKIIWVAISSQEENAWALEYRAKKYNQKKDNAYVEVEQFDGTLEDYLGRGERPDIVVMPDQSEIAPLVELNALTDLNPLMEKQDKYSVDDLLPRIREALSVGDSLYAMGDKFQLLVCVSDGTECDAQGKCTTLEYLRWFDECLTQNEVKGMPDFNLFFFGLIQRFYDEGAKKAYFASEEFRELMVAYKELKKKHAGSYEYNIEEIRYDIDKIILHDIVKGPVWIGEMLQINPLVRPDCRICGIPTPDGERAAYLRLYHPMGILSTSENKEEALDFILYVCRSTTHLGRSITTNETRETKASESQTMGRFWVFDDYLKDEIWETEKPCWYVYLEEPKVGSRASLEVFYITEEHKEMLRNLMDQAVGVTKAQNDIYGMFLEEMDAYINGNKDLDACCDILQNRVSLYLTE